MEQVARFIHDESGQDLVEYALLAAFVSIISVAALRTLGVKVNSFYQTLEAQF